MKNSNINLSKIFIAFTIIISLFIFYQFSQNGRYQLNNNYPGVITDTMSGKVYHIINGKTILFSKIR